MVDQARLLWKSQWGMPLGHYGLKNVRIPLAGHEPSGSRVMNIELHYFDLFIYSSNCNAPFGLSVDHTGSTLSLDTEAAASLCPRHDFANDSHLGVHLLNFLSEFL